MIEIMWTCCDNEVYDHPDILTHLQTVHGLTLPVEARAQFLQALDGPGWSMNTFEVRIGELILHQSVKTTAEGHHPHIESTRSCVLCECDDCISAKGGEA